MVRFKNRWLLLSIDFTTPPASEGDDVEGLQRPSGAAASANLTAHQILQVIRSSLHTHFGLAASGALGGPLQVKYYSPKTHFAILRSARVGAETVRAAVSLISEIGTSRQKVRIHVVHVGGTIKKIQERVIRMDRAAVQQETAKAKASTKRQKTKQARKAQNDGKSRPQQSELPRNEGAEGQMEKATPVPNAGAGSLKRSSSLAFDDDEDLGLAV